jgi:glycosyltransferase involved in cell wall biosynthesis
MCEIKAMIPQARLLLVGDGPDRENLEGLSRSLGLEGIVVFAGQRRDIARLLAMADLFVFPSVYEGFGIALVEAMAMGKPVVASRVEGILEIVTHEVSGLLIEPHSPQEIVNAVIRLHRDSSLRERLGEQARKTSLERFGVKAGISRLEAIYMSLVGDRAFAFG